MAQLLVQGPIDVTDEIARLILGSMTEEGRHGLALMWSSRLLAGPLSEQSLVAVARVVMEKANVPAAAKAAVRKAACEKCEKIGDESINRAMVESVALDEVRRQAPSMVQDRLKTILDQIPDDKIVEAAVPLMAKFVDALAERYFLKTQEGQKRMMGILDAACERGQDELAQVAKDQLIALEEVRIPERIRKRKTG